MKNPLSYIFVLNSFVLLFFVGQLWSSTINYCFWMMDSQQEFIEFSTSEDNESEEENEKQDKEDKNRNITFDFNFCKAQLALKQNCWKNFISLHYPDISTPPPR